LEFAVIVFAMGRYRGGKSGRQARDVLDDEKLAKQTISENMVFEGIGITEVPCSCATMI
jgi:hypothetical protein